MPIEIPPCPPSCPDRRPACQGKCPIYAPYAEKVERNRAARHKFYADKSSWTYGRSHFFEYVSRENKGRVIRNGRK